MSGIDLIAHDRTAVSMGGESIELARTPISAVAVGEFSSVDRPFCPGHRNTFTERKSELKRSDQIYWPASTIWPIASANKCVCDILRPPYPQERTGRIRCAEGAESLEMTLGNRFGASGPTKPI
jgi:hypothetical protein